MAIVVLAALPVWWWPRHAPPAPSSAPLAAVDAGVTQVEPPSLRGPRAIVGRVQDDRGEPLHGALVRVSSLVHPDRPAREVLTTADGAFHFDDLPAEALALEVSCAGHEAKEHALHAQDDERLTFVLARQGELHVALRDSPPHGVDNSEVVITGPGVWPAQAGTSDARGELVFKGLPAGQYRVRARRDTRVALPAESVDVVPGRRSEVELVLEAGETLSGTVLDQQSRRPIAHASVSVQDLTPGIDAFEFITNERGEFHAHGLWPGALRVDAQHEGYAASALDLSLPHPAKIELLLAGAASISGTVVDATGRPLANARLSVTTAEGLPLDFAVENRREAVGELGITEGPVPALPLFEGSEFALGTLAAQSDARGGFFVGRLAPGSLALHVALPGYVAERVAVANLQPREERTDLQVMLREAGRVVGRIADARGQPLAGVYVAARAGDREQSAITDASGQYVLRDLLGEVWVEAQADGRSTLRCRADVVARTDARCDLTADSALHTLTVRVVDDYGLGLEGALVTVSTRASTDAQVTRSPSTQLTRRDGSVVLRDLAAPPPYLLDVKLSGHLGIEDLTIHDANHEVRIKLARAATLAGFVVDNLGRAVPNAFVSTQEGEASTDADAQGRFTLDGVPPGTHSLLAHHARAGDGKSSEVRARPSELLDGVRIVLNGRYVPGEEDAGVRATEAPIKRDFLLEQRGPVIVVTQINNGSAAMKAGLRIGDVISAIDGEPPLSTAHARGILRDPAGRTALVRVSRNKRSINLRYVRPR